MRIKDNHDSADIERVLARIEQTQRPAHPGRTLAALAALGLCAAFLAGGDLGPGGPAELDGGRPGAAVAAVRAD